MGARKAVTVRRVVLDTNVVLSALLFAHGRLAWLRLAWQSGQIRPLVCRESVTELMRVLAYPKFRLSADEQRELLADFLPHAETAVLTSPWPELERCRDADDQMFLALAYVADVDALLSGDADLLALAGSFPLPILTPEAFRVRL